MSRVLIVDDVPVLRRKLVRLARTLDGVETTEAASSQEAIDLIRTNDFDLVVTDLVMESNTEEDGRAVLREAKRANPDSPVIAVTSFGSPESSAETMKLGAYDYIERGSPDVNLGEVLPRTIAGALEHRAEMLKGRELRG